MTIQIFICSFIYLFIEVPFQEPQGMSNIQLQWKQVGFLDNKKCVTILKQHLCHN